MRNGLLRLWIVFTIVSVSVALYWYRDHVFAERVEALEEYYARRVASGAAFGPFPKRVDFDLLLQNCRETAGDMPSLTCSDIRLARDVGVDLSPYIGDGNNPQYIQLRDAWKAGDAKVADWPIRLKYVAISLIPSIFSLLSFFAFQWVSKGFKE